MKEPNTENRKPKTLLPLLVAVPIVTAYLAYLTIGMYWHLVGDTGAAPAVQYFVTWDMFPSYRSTGRRIVVIGETEAGRFVEVYPSPRHRARTGMYGELTRLDNLPQPLVGTGGVAFEGEVVRTLAEFDDPDDPVRQVHVLQETWPAKFNLPPSAYETIALTGDPPTGTRTWTLVVTREAASLRDTDGVGP